MNGRGLPGSVAEAEDMRACADARGIIAEVHAYCARRCPLRERCPGMECRQYRREMEARDVLADYASAPTFDAPIGVADVILEPQVGR